MDIQDIMMDDSVLMQAANLQRRNANGKSVETYVWFDKASAKDFGLGDGSRGVWANEDWSPIDPAIILREGDCVQIDVGDSSGVKISNSGEVSDGDITYRTRVGFNFIGNAYPAKLNIQDIMMDDSVLMQAANLQRRNANGKSVETYVWFDKASAKDFGLGDGSRGVWANEDWSPIDPAIILESGEGIQVDVGDATGVLVTTLAPIEL